MGLTRRQKWRIDKIQAERIARAQRVAGDSESLLVNADNAQTGLLLLAMVNDY